MSLDQAREKALAKQLHHRFAVPGREGVECAMVREGAVGHEKVSMWMPLDQVAAGRDGDHEAGPGVRSDLSPHVLGEGKGGALREVEQKLPPLPEDPAQEARHGEDDMTMRNGLEHFLLQPLGPQELFFLLA